MYSPIAIFEKQIFYKLNFFFQDADITISKVLRKEDRYCYMDAVVTVVFVDVNKCQTVTNFLAEKLDETVKISFPEFFHSGAKLETLR
jgi:hypothetical protein